MCVAIPISNITCMLIAPIALTSVRLVAYAVFQKIYILIFQIRYLYNINKKEVIFVDFKFERKINYYETDRMGVVHHSNYIRFLEEARCSMMDAYGISYAELEKRGLMIPVLGVNINFKHHVTFNDIIIIKPFVKEFNGVRLTIGYDVTDKATGNVVLNGETKHCFTNKLLKPVRLQKVAPDYYEKFMEMKK